METDEKLAFFISTFPLCVLFFWQLIFIVRDLSLRTLIIAFTDTVGFRLCAQYRPARPFSPDEQRSVISACQRQPLRTGASPAGRLFGHIMLKTRVI